MAEQAPSPHRIEPTAPTLGNFLRNLRDVPSSLSISGITAGFIIILISYTGPLLIILQAAQAGGYTPEQTASWVWAVMVGNGVLTIIMSLLFRMPITAPYSTAGAALLVISLSQYSINQAVGAYIVANAGLMLLGISGLFGRLMRLIPQPVVLAVLGGVLLRFGLNLFNGVDDAPGNAVLIIAMVVVFFGLKRLKFRAPSLGALAVGVLVTVLQGRLNLPPFSLAFTLPGFYLSEFSPDAILSLSLPLIVLAASSQYAPGQAVLLGNHFAAPIDRILAINGFGSIILAFFGGHGQSLGALTAALVVGPDAQPDHDKRYASAVAGGVWHVAIGVFGAGVLGLFGGFPAVFVPTIAGLSLSGVIASSLAGAMERPETRDAALIAFLCTAGDFTLLGIGAPFWGLLAGVGVHLLMHRHRRHHAPAA